MYLEILKKAINLKQSISFNYKNQGKRIGNPHIIYSFTTLKNVTSIKVDIEQISGYSSSGTSFPSFRGFNIKDITDVRFLDDKFKKSSYYNSSSDRYNKSICEY